VTTAALMYGDCGDDDGDCSDNNGMVTVMTQQSSNDATVRRRCNSVAMMQQCGDNATVQWRWHGECGKDSMVVTTAMMAQ